MNYEIRLILRGIVLILRTLYANAGHRQEEIKIFEQDVKAHFNPVKRGGMG